MFHGPFRSFRARHPLARLVAGALGALALLLMLALGMFAIAALVIGGGLFLLVNAFRAPRPVPAATRRPPPPGVIEGEFTVVSGQDDRTRARR